MASSSRRARRGAGEGAIYQEPNGLWASSVEVGFSPDGKRLRRKVRGRTKAIVVEKLNKLRSDVEAGTPVVDNRRTTEDYLRWWLADVLPSTVKESTAEGYTWILEHYVIPHIGRVPLSKLTPQHVHRMLRRLEEDGKSPRSRQYARAVLRRALSYADRWDLVSRNAAALVEGPKVGGSKLDDTLTAAQAAAVISAAEGDRLEALAVIVLRLGLRKGEALGLRWEAIDFDQAELTIHGTLKRRPGGGLVLDTPKTRASGRTLPLPPGCVTALQAHRQHQAEELEIVGVTDNPWVFTTPIGTAIDPRNINRWWDQLCTKAEVGHHRFHATRHTAATLLLDSGVPLEVVSAILGHAGLAITADIYAKVTNDAKRRALTRLELPD
jgi:integrase